jgi:hypothetical protein
MALYRNGRPRATLNEGTRLSAPTKVGRNAEAEYGEVGAGRWVVIAAYHLTRSDFGTRRLIRDPAQEIRGGQIGFRSFKKGPSVMA